MRRQARGLGATSIRLMGSAFLAALLANTLPAAAVDLNGIGSASFLNHLGDAGDHAKIKFKRLTSMGSDLPSTVCPAAVTITAEKSSGEVQQETYPLECSAFTQKGSKLAFKSKSGEIRALTVGLDKVTIKAKGTEYGTHPISGRTEWVEVSLSLGDTSYCGRFANPLARAKDNNAEKVTWKGGVVGCSYVPPTPTPTSTPTIPPVAESTVPRVRLTSPEHGSFTNSNSLLVSGEILNAVEGMAVRVNGVPVTPVGNQFSVSLPVDSNSIVNTIVAEVEAAGSVVRDTVTVLVGQHTDAAQVNPAAYQFQMGTPLLHQLEPLIAQQIQHKFDGINIVPPGTGLHISGPPEVNFGLSSGITSGGFTFAISPSDGSLNTALIIPGMNFNLTAEVVVPMVWPIPDLHVGCTNIGLRVGQTTFHGQFSVHPGSPLSVEENDFDLDLGSVDTGGASCGGIPLDPLLSGFTPILRSLISDLLRNPASVTNAPVKTALQDALIPYAAAPFVGTILAPTLASVNELISGLAMSWSSQLGNSGSLPSIAPKLAGCFIPNLSNLPLGPLTPQGQPYAAAVSFAASTLNQLLQAGIEQGGLIKQWGQVPFGAFGTPTLTPELLDSLVPGLNLSERLGPYAALLFRLTPSHPFQTWSDGKSRGAAPFFTGNPGPGGSMSELMIPLLSFDLVDPSTGEVLLRGAFQGRVGVDFGLQVDPTTGETTLHVTVTDIDWTDIALLFLEDPSGLEVAAIDYLLPLALQELEPYIQQALAQLPIEQLTGYDPSQIDIVNANGTVDLFVAVH